ncbi:hypothetical protein [Limnofasciculus baicalensis]|uniref:Uncharacterized protein n=1 Tax=Limnofasciculus baicalensis BBK-W-15 TaxID=2699891 RepID=A0AAE3GST3_9CYAN|nr:hypothetical protein [Limnofasciculus baicalensis]MCP2729624.1 hypothetical protein [Limnofasciculus baicalensis BBK-W-15]
MNLSNNNDSKIIQAIQLMRLIFAYPKYKFNPQAIIKAANYLHHLGYEKSIQALQSYCELIEEMEQEMEDYFALQMEMEKEMETNFPLQTEDEMPEEMEDEMEEEDDNLKMIWRLQNEQNNAMMTARLLFIRQDGQAVLPDLRIGKPMMMEIPENPEIFPLFPLHIHRGIPLFLVMGYIVLGEPQPPSNYIEWCARECQLRAKPLIPDSHPLAAVEEFLKSAPCQGLYPDYGFNESLQSQVLCAVSNIYPVSKEYRDELLASNPGEDIWSLHQKAFAQLNAVWNPITNEYEINS